MDIELAVTSLFPASPREQDAATRLFADELRRGGVRSDPVQVVAPPGAKSGTGQAIGQLAVAGVFSAATVQAVSRIAVAFINRRSAQKIRLTAAGVRFEIDGELGEAQQAALARIVAALAERGGADR